MKLLVPFTISSVGRGLNHREYHTEDMALFHAIALNITAFLLRELDALKTMQRYDK